MAEVDQEKHLRYKNIAHKCMDDFAREESLLSLWGWIFSSKKFKHRTQYVMRFYIKENNPNNPLLNVYLEDYLDKAKQIAEEIEKRIGDNGVKVEVRESYNCTPGH